ncbi:ImmA/IrrE family metallo-endopeptidase [Salibacterium lacus]|uniref:ImmA/IrrE family metallo-endopeptidase n=1 Tax=Salibacterium lacus TaxID=1898109 RepID=A0ABW5SXJ8_9BACI
MVKTHLEEWIEAEYSKRGISSLEDLQTENLVNFFNIVLKDTETRSTSISDGEFSVIFINLFKSKYEQRYDLFHELGHVLKHHGDQRRLPLMMKQYLEGQAHTFCLFAAMPYEFMRPLLKSNMLPAEIAEYLVLPVDIVKQRMEQLSRNYRSDIVQSKASEYKGSLKSRSYNPSQWTRETWKIMNQLKNQTGQEVINHVGLLRRD